MSKQIIMYVWMVSSLPVYAFNLAIYWNAELWKQVTSSTGFKSEIIIYVIILLFWTVIMLIASTVMLLSQPKKEETR